MRSAKTILVLHCMLGLLLCCGNLYVAVGRSLIPVALNGQVTNRETRFEKHRGKDDVYLLTLDNDNTVQVDQAIFEAIQVGDGVSKAAWSSQLSVSSLVVPLELSRDARGMLWAMPAAFLVVLAAAVWGWRLSRYSAGTTGRVNVSTAE